MAAAEARAAWQRTANRCFVQEDAKRAPKLACVPSSLSKQADTRAPTNGVDDFAPATTNSMYSNLSPDSRWWLQLHPNYMYQKGLSSEQVSSHQFVDIMDVSYNANAAGAGEESYEFVEMKEVEEFSLESEFPHWMENEKTQELPWWRMTDRDDLASFVAQRSQDFMENCDLPQPQPQNRNRNLNQRPHKKDELFTCFGLSKSQKRQCQNEAAIHASVNADSRPVSPLSGESCGCGCDDEGSKRKLLEALCHSQTRAREAEKAAKQAYEEKEHVVKLIFKQASQLFAYKQWVYLLQLENLYNQIQIKTNTAAQPPRKKARTPATKRKTRAKRHDDDDDDDRGGGGGNYGVAFAVGLGLVGAGLLLGWTVGWMFI